jgi:tRNA(Arg) A34 adenosine deaminase TadA
LTLLDTLKTRALERAKARPDTRHFLLGAAALRADGAIVVARNEGTMVPTPDAHAEARVLRKAGLAPDLVLVVRLDRNGNLALAKPCAACETKLRNSRVREIWYSTAEGLVRL